MTETGQPLVDVILDAAEQKGTGRWTIESALELASPVPTIDAAVTARNLSALRGLARAGQRGPARPHTTRRPRAGAGHARRRRWPGRGAQRARGLRSTSRRSPRTPRGCRCSAAASTTYNWNLNLSEIARIWTGGCIIRAAFLADIMRAYRDNPKLTNLLLDPEIARQSDETVGGARRAIVAARSWGIPVPGTSSALDYFDTLRQIGPSRQPHAGPARLLRRAHLPAHRPRRDLPHPLARGRSNRRNRSRCKPSTDRLGGGRCRSRPPPGSGRRPRGR